jgi:hypothetical protein
MTKRIIGQLALMVLNPFEADFHMLSGDGTVALTEGWVD